MKETSETPFKNMKKISLDLNEEILEIIDKLAKLTKTNRTVIIGALIGQGMSPYFRYLEKTWKGFLDEKKFDEKKKKLIKETLQNLKKIEINMWDPDHYQK